MFIDLMQQLQKPEKFKQPDKMFWKDPHIAKYLLEAHLDPNNEGASRNTNFIDQSVDFIKKIATKKGDQNIIDFGCGPGLYCERLAKRGYDVTGVDFSENSIKYAKDSAKDKGLDIKYRNENYLYLTNENQYDFATLIYCDYGALAPNDRKKLLQNICRSLIKGGSFLLDVFTEHKYNVFSEGNNWYLRDEGGFWSPESYIELTQNLKYDGYISLEQTTVITKQKTETYYIWNQYFTKEMILGELEEAGFTLISIYNDVTGEEYQEGNDTMALLLEKSY
ncbi:SAM-dependent methyltransferase [Bacillus sp. SA1-12]|uniref:class I SAM-dependent methyltransferase n=1 Tax=Bacillus sp. SA1-12 TaxID=1455638 RepID=UPI0006259B59|nr:class I SAM-dependent methyltransferase [Bacillus sp. SA1-12]KKI91714.1 SAM-dependent methyltransferase [Bacillus sp. SA1-12]